jgi:Phage portal protein
VKLFENLGHAWKALRGQGSRPPGDFGGSWGGGPFWSNTLRTRRAPSPADLIEAYKAISYCCANLNARAVSQTPLRLYAVTKKKHHRPKCATKSLDRPTIARICKAANHTKVLAGAEEIEEVTEHPILDALNWINDDLDRVQILHFTVVSMDILGHAFWWPYVGRRRLPEEFWALPADRVYPVFNNDSMVPDKWQFGSYQYDRRELIRFRHVSLKNPYGSGYGPAQASYEYNRLEGTFVSLQDDMLSAGPRPSLVVSHRDPKGAFGEAERKRLEVSMNQKARGGVFVVDGAASVTPVSWQPSDIGQLGISEYDLSRIANAHDVPISMLQTKDVNRANAEAGLEQHARQAVQPRCEAIETTLTRWLHGLDEGGKFGWDRLFFKFDGVVKEDKAAQIDLLTKLVAMGLPLNSALLEAGYERVEGGDVPLIASGLVTLESVVNPPEPAVPVVRSTDGDNRDGEEFDDEEPDEEPEDSSDPAEEPEPVGAKSPATDARLHAVLASINSKIGRLQTEGGLGGAPMTRR